MKVGDLIDHLSRFPREWHVLGFLSFPLASSNYLFNLINIDGYATPSSIGAGNVLISMKGGEYDMIELSPTARMDRVNDESR